MNPHVSFLDTFSNMFNKRDSQIQADNQRKIAGVNNILHSLGEVEIPVDHLQAENIHIYAHNKGYYEPELQFLRAAFNILNIKHEYHEIPYPNIGYGELPLLRIEYMIFTKQHFVDVVFRLLFNGSDILEDLSNNGVLLLIKELHKVTNYYMWATDTIHYKYRNRRWLLFQPIWRTQELYGNYKKRIALAQDGIDSNIFAIEKAKEILAQLEKVQTKFHGFYAGDKQNNILKSQIMDLLVYTYLQELIRNTVESDLYNLLIEKHSELKRFTEEFERVLPTLFEQRLVAPATKVKLQKPDLTHTYQSRYRTAEEIKKQHTNSIFLSVTSVSLLLYVYFYYKG